MCVQLPNVGHQAHTLLTHIIDRYDSLANVTFFQHGAINYREDQQISAQRTDAGAAAYAWEDFVSTDPDFLAYIARQADEGSWRMLDYNETLADVYSLLFGDAYPSPPPTFGVGALVAVGRNKLRSRPRSFYERHRDWVLSPYQGRSEVTAQ